MPEPTTPKDTSKATSRKVYRFGLYGVSAAGKTCLLAALGMNRKPNSRGYDAVRLPCTLPTPGGDPQDWPPDDPAAAAHRGEHWLDGAVDALRTGRVPPPNNPYLTPGSMSFSFDVSAPDRTWHVELFDYSGELVNARQAADPEALAARLLEHLHAMDGLLVLAAAPRPWSIQERDHQDLLILKEAFAALRARTAEGPVLTKPVGLLINKWDRQAEGLTGDLEAQQSRLEQFLADDRHSAWQGLAHAIQNSVADGLFARFPVSAFGRSERVQDEDGEIIERPVQAHELPAFGIEDPIVWAARAVDEADLANFEKQSKDLSWIGWFWKAHRLAEEGAPLVRRFAPGTDERRQTEQAQTRCRKCAAARFILLVAGILFAYLLGEFTVDTVQYRRAMATFHDDKATPEQVAAAETWCGEYAMSFRLRHLGLASLIFSRDDAVEALRQFHERRETQFWDEVVSASPGAQRAAAASRYLEEFPMGRHAPEAEALIAKFAYDTRVGENKEWLARQKDAAARAIPLASESQLKQVLDELASPPHPDAVNEDLRRELGELRSRVNDKHTEIVLKKDWERFLAAYEQALAQQRFRQAADMLRQRQPTDESLRQTRQQFAAALPAELTRCVGELIEKRYWDDARNLLAGLARDHVEWPDEMRFDGAAELFEVQLQRVAETHDKSLYDRFRKFKTEEAAKAYLALDTASPMRQDVQKYLDYLEARRQKHNFTVVLEAIEWADQYPADDDNMIRFEVDGRLVKQTNADIASTPDGQTGEIAEYELKGQRALSSTVELKVRIRNVETIILDALSADHLGEQTETMKLSDLDGYRQKINVEDLGECRARYRLEGGPPPEPALPAWRRQ